MTRVTNQDIIDRYLDRYKHSKPSVASRKYALQYFFQGENVSYLVLGIDQRSNEVIQRLRRES